MSILERLEQMEQRMAEISNQGPNSDAMATKGGGVEGGGATDQHSQVRQKLDCLEEFLLKGLWKPNIKANIYNLNCCLCFRFLVYNICINNLFRNNWYFICEFIRVLMCTTLCYCCFFPDHKIGNILWWKTFVKVPLWSSFALLSKHSVVFQLWLYRF